MEKKARTSFFLRRRELRWTSGFSSELEEIHLDRIHERRLLLLDTIQNTELRVVPGQDIVINRQKVGTTN